MSIFIFKVTQRITILSKPSFKHELKTYITSQCFTILYLVTMFELEAKNHIQITWSTEELKLCQLNLNWAHKPAENCSHNNKSKNHLGRMSSIEQGQMTLRKLGLESATHIGENQSNFLMCIKQQLTTKELLLRIISIDFQFRPYMHT